MTFIIQLLITLTFKGFFFLIMMLDTSKRQLMIPLIHAFLVKCFNKQLTIQFLYLTLQFA